MPDLESPSGILEFILWVQQRRRPTQGTHWDGCEAEHHACALAKLAEARQERDELAMRVPAIEREADAMQMWAREREAREKAERERDEARHDAAVQTGWGERGWKEAEALRNVCRILSEGNK